MSIAPGGLQAGVAAKLWNIQDRPDLDPELIAAAGGSELLARLMYHRGIRNAADAKAYLDAGLYAPSHWSALDDVEAAVARIEKAISQSERITVFGDYDVDGITATSVLLTVLRELGAQVDYYIPNRASEGYGLNLKAVSVLASKHRTKLIITCDCGISNFAEINFARSLGVDTIVVDHHSMPDVMPPAVAVLHPRRLPEDHALYELSGVGVAYKLAEALLDSQGRIDGASELLDYVTLGLIADMVPLCRENRYLVQVGMPRLVQSTRPGIRALLGHTGQREGTDLVGFGLAPRLNAAGRLSDARSAVELLTTADELEARRLANELEVENTRRQELCEQVFAEADQQVRQSGRLGRERAIAIYAPGWHHGVVGIVASRLVDKYGVPVFIGEWDETEGLVKGSARGVAGIDLHAVLKSNEHLALRWGGHKMAAGFTVEIDKAEHFCKAVIDECTRRLEGSPLKPVLEVDCEVAPDALSIDTARSIARMAPFGIGNRKPVFALRGMQCAAVRPLGREGKHHRLSLSAEGREFEAVMWNSRGRIPEIGQVVDVAVNADINAYNGSQRLQLIVADWFDPAVPQDAAAAAPAPADLAAVVGTAAAFGASDEAGGRTQSPVLQDLPVLKQITSRVMQWKDLRDHSDPRALLEAARRKLGQQAAIFGEAVEAPDGFQLVGRLDVREHSHLLLWQYPPSLQVFRSLIRKSEVQHVYLIGADQQPSVSDPAVLLKKLFGLVKYAANHKDGQVEPDRLAAALAVDKMSLALGLTILKKIHVIDWFSEDGWLFVDVIGQPEGYPEDVPEFRQLGVTLSQVAEFRRWCAEMPLAEIQLAIVPNAVDARKPSEASHPNAPAALPVESEA